MVRIDEDHLFNGLKGDLRPGPRGNMGHIVWLKPETRMCPNITGPYIYIYIYIYIKVETSCKNA